MIFHNDSCSAGSMSACRRCTVSGVDGAQGLKLNNRVAKLLYSHWLSLGVGCVSPGDSITWITPQLASPEESSLLR